MLIIHVTLYSVKQSNTCYPTRHTWLSLCHFLEGKSNVVAGSDTNHNSKSLRGQIVGGGDTVPPSIGRFMIDADLLRLAEVSRSLWRPEDFSSDLLVEALIKVENIIKVIKVESPIGSTVDGDKGALAVTMFMMSLHSYAVNSKECKAKHRAIYLWTTMIWFTSINGVSLVTKRNIVTETMSMMFLVVRDDVIYTRYCTSEMIEHHFGNCRGDKREFT